MSALVALWLALFGAGPDSHVAAARLAGELYGVPPEKLLAIADHESGLDASAVTREPGHRVSCGAMTPTPQSRCAPWELTPLGGYLAGAAHWALWRRICRGSEWCADLAYGGGLGLVRACNAGRTVPGARGDACDLHIDLVRRARRFRVSAQ